MTVLAMRSLRSCAVLAGLLLAGIAPALAQERDPAYDRFVDLDQLSTAWEQKDPELLTDIALQLLEGERVLLRPNKYITADQVFNLAIKVAADTKDTPALKRLA